MYFVGILLIFLGALLIKRITGYKYRKSFFIMELPEYKIPSLKRACFSMLERAKAYIIKAATIILVCNCVVQLMQTFNWHFQVVAEGAEDTSILATIASPFAVLLDPAGIRSMAAGSSSDHWIYRKGKRCRYAGSCLRHHQLHRYRRTGSDWRCERGCY